VKVWENSKKLWKHLPTARVPQHFSFSQTSARDFYGVIVDKAEGRINYHLIEIESESNCFSRVLT